MTRSKLKKQTYEGRNDTANDKRNNIGPGREGDVVLQDDDEAEEKADDEDDHVPPPWRVFVVLDHVLMVTIIEHTLACALVCFVDVFAPEKDDVGNECTDLDLLSES